MLAAGLAAVAVVAVVAGLLSVALETLVLLVAAFTFAEDAVEEGFAVVTGVVVVGRAVVVVLEVAEVLAGLVGVTVFVVVGVVLLVEDVDAGRVVLVLFEREAFCSAFC